MGDIKMKITKTYLKQIIKEELSRLQEDLYTEKTKIENLISKVESTAYPNLSGFGLGDDIQYFLESNPEATLQQVADEMKKTYIEQAEDIQKAVEAVKKEALQAQSGQNLAQQDRENPNG